ncbi:type II toxin-antitoxin system RelE/ParE family toxin [Novosphingobium sp. PY1]|uniref:type II toxin-antitoxin system RelE/ParE family toxin n=1 Tax=Novosphingobium sp. PY1 TaxID=1882221 RepID=UPI000BE786D8|nr:type II toxin-antitoxin system RelE/ParE family toxin [Novosphingobium sp. PY1]BBA74048.1 plasmid stabilization protein [Novosphingobium sp. PY1]GFM31285.1 plasmid stabilization protein [Novosphingobium sp. PY1]
MTPPYVLTAAAEDDLRSIVRYTRKQWGSAQVRSYIAKLEQDIVRLASGQGPFKEMGELYPGLRLVHCEHHYIFCLPRGAEPALIVAILHERMDLVMRLESRLK